MIDEQPNRLLALLDTYGNNDGMLWEELVIRFEWTFELQRILDDASLSDDVREAVGEAGRTCKYDFNKAMVEAWQQSLVGNSDEGSLIDSLVQYIYEPKNYNAYRQ